MAKTILVADDSPRIRKLLCSLFEPEEDYEICAEAANGQEAIALALMHRPDLIILDLSMPVMDGVTAARELRTSLPGVPISCLRNMRVSAGTCSGPICRWTVLCQKLNWENSWDTYGHSFRSESV